MLKPLCARTSSDGVTSDLLPWVLMGRVTLAFGAHGDVTNTAVDSDIVCRMLPLQLRLWGPVNVPTFVPAV